jgi:hypothetical protein
MAGCRYLLLGHSPGRPRNPLGLADTLRHHGLPTRAARNTAMMDALVDLPPMVIADLLGIHPKTAEPWATLAGGNWSEYLAARRALHGARQLSRGSVPNLRYWGMVSRMRPWPPPASTWSWALAMSSSG